MLLAAYCDTQCRRRRFDHVQIKAWLVRYLRPRAGHLRIADGKCKPLPFRAAILFRKSRRDNFTEELKVSRIFGSRFETCRAMTEYRDDPDTPTVSRNQHCKNRIRARRVLTGIAQHDVVRDLRTDRLLIRPGIRAHVIAIKLGGRQDIPLALTNDLG